MSGVVDTVAAHWGRRADTFDDEPDHGLTDPATQSAWRRRLVSWLPNPPARVADLGCGTGSLSVLLATMAYDVTASDVSPAMVDQARRKADTARVTVEVNVADASAPALPDHSLDVVLVRHLAWTLPDPHAALDRWAALLRPGGRLVMVEGRWSMPHQHGDSTSDETLHGDYATVHRQLPWYGGVSAPTLIAVLEELVGRVECYNLSGEDILWGREVSDERFAVVAHTR